MKKAVLLGFGMAALSTVAAHAGTMGAATTGAAYPAGFVIGGDVGYGYLSYAEAAALIPPSPATGAFSLNNGAFIWGVHGGYDISILDRLLMGFEVGYKDLGKSSSSFSVSYPGSYFDLTNDPVNQQSSITLHQQAVDFLFTSRVYVLNGLNIFGKAGPAYVRSKANDHDSVSYPAGVITTKLKEVSQSINVSPTIWRLRPELAIGVGYSFKNNLDVHLMYTYINGSDFNEAAGILSTGSLAAPVSNGVSAIRTNSFSGVAAYNAVSIGLSYYFG